MLHEEDARAIEVAQSIQPSSAALDALALSLRSESLPQLPHLQAPCAPQIPLCTGPLPWTLLYQASFSFLLHQHGGRSPAKTQPTNRPLDSNAASNHFRISAEGAVAAPQVPPSVAPHGARRKKP